MKLHHQPDRLVRTTAAEAAGRPPEDEVSIFDPEKDIPVELFERNKLLLAGPEPEWVEQMKVIHGAWYGTINPAYRSQMRTSRWLKRVWIKQFRDSLQDARQKVGAIGSQRKAIMNCVSELARFVQVFPESRSEALSGLPDIYAYILKQYDPIFGSLEIDRLVEVFEIWPDKKAEVLRLYFPDGIPTQMSEANNSWDLSALLLAFPHFRPQAARHLEEKRTKYAKEVKGASTDSTSEIAIQGYHDSLRIGAILAAQSAWIDETGREHIEFAEKQLSQPTPLPVRPGV